LRIFTNMSNNTTIYTLSHPKTGEVRYVGKTIQSLSTRLFAHIGDSKRLDTYCARWIRFLLAQGLKPVIEPIDQVPNEQFAFWECHYISLFKSWGFRLTNCTLGGEGRLKYATEAERKIAREKYTRPIGFRYRQTEGGKRATKRSVDKYYATANGKRANRKAVDKYSETEAGIKTRKKAQTKYNLTEARKEVEKRYRAKRKLR